MLTFKGEIIQTKNVSSAIAGAVNKPYASRHQQAPSQLYYQLIMGIVRMGVRGFR